MRTRIFMGLMITTRLVLAAAVNDPAPSFRLSNLHQQKISLGDLKGKVVFINFWASWCAPCQSELPEIQRLATDYKGKKVRIVAINVDEDASAAKKMLTRLGLPVGPLEILLDSKSKVVSAYNIESMPSSFVVDSRGLIRNVHVGFHPRDPAVWRQELDALLMTTNPR